MSILMPRVNGILLLYCHPLVPRPLTIMEHVDAFRQYSRFSIYAVNTLLGFVGSLSKLRFSAIVLHYSLFGKPPFELDDRFMAYLEESDAYKVAFFQDEYHYCVPRYELLNRLKVDCVYTLLEPRYFGQVYGKHTRVPRLVSTIPGYVSDDLVELGQRFTKPDEARSVDVGYRGRKLWYYTGKGGQEKTEIARRFVELAEGRGLRLDIELDEDKRIYGTAWYEFVADCRAVLGVESGVSIFDVEDVVVPAYKRLIAEKPQMSFEEMSRLLLEEWEDNIFYRTISPRHFEAAALRVCQILYEGEYSGILKPMVHYIPLKKDFTNIDEVIRLFKDAALRRELTENTYRDLIASGRYTYRQFIAEFDRGLLDEGLRPDVASEQMKRVTSQLEKDWVRLKWRYRLDQFLGLPFPGRQLVAPVGKRVRGWWRSRVQS